MQTQAQVIGFFGEKGGLGKTTTAVCVAAELARQGFKVTLLDCDEPKHEAVRWALMADEKNLLQFNVEQRGLTQLRGDERFDADFVILDLPGHRSPIFKAAAPLADLVLMPVGPSWDAWSVKPAARLVDSELGKMARNGRAALCMRVFFARTRPGIRSSVKTIDGLRQTMRAEGVEVLAAEVRDLTAFRERLLDGELPGHKDREARRDIKALAQEITTLLKTRRRSHAKQEAARAEARPRPDHPSSAKRRGGAEGLSEGAAR